MGEIEFAADENCTAGGASEGTATKKSADRSDSSNERRIVLDTSIGPSGDGVGATI
jgi:hypothetical protein